MNENKNLKKGLGIHARRFIAYVVLILVTFACLFWFYVLFINATRSNGELQAGFTPLPSTHLLENWNNLVHGTLPVWQGMINSLIVSVLSAALCTYFSTMTAYAIHAYDFKLKKYIYAFILAVMMIPTQVTALGFVKLVGTLHMEDTFIPLIVPTIAAPVTFFYMKQYMESTLPVSLIEAARIDLFLVEADYALKYVDTDYTMPIADLGITDADLANQYQYTKDIVTDSNGVLKGVSWQGCPGVLFYNRDAAKEVLGTDDPDEVQKYVSGWDTFNDTAETMKAAGYKMTSSVNDTYRVYSNNVTSKWVEDGKINIDDNIMKWVSDSKELYDAGETETYELWGDDWKKGFYPEGKVFCYFGPAWFVNFSMAADTEGSIGYNGGWGATPGPQGFYWGGTWICGATGTDNASLVKDIILKMTTDETIMKDIVVKDDDFVNNKPAMEAMAADTSYQSKVLGGQNPLSMYCASVEKLDLSNLSAYDQGCNEEFQNAMKNYFEGNASLDDALDLFYKAVVEKYPDLTY